MFPVRVLATAGILIMTVSLLVGAAQADFWAELDLILGSVWGVVMLVDLYVGFALIVGWIVWREDSRVAKIVWAALVLGLGNLASCMYLLRALYQARGDATVFWMGQREQIEH